MAMLYSYFTALVENIYSVFWWNSSSSTPANSSTANQNQAEPSESSNQNHLHIPPPYYPDETAKVDRVNIIVKCAGKTMEVDMFPLERISVLIEEACEQAEKKPEKMSLVYEGNRLDVNKTVSQYRLRGGTVVHLIHA